MFKIGFDNSVKKVSVTVSKMWSKNDSAKIKFLIEYPRKFILSVRMKSATATLVLKSIVVMSGSRDRIKEKTIMKNCRSATDIITKLIAVA